jgi:membrane-bound ClpP family serine protease
MFWLVIAILIVIGLLCLVLEILVIPGTGVAGIIGFALLAIGIWQAYAVYGPTAGHLTVGGTIVLTLVTLILSLRAKTWRRIMLDSKIDSRVNIIDDQKLKVGDSGKTISRLVPAGKAFINGEFYEVRTTGEFLDPETLVEVEKIESNKIFVKPKT